MELTMSCHGVDREFPLSVGIVIDLMEVVMELFGSCPLSLGVVMELCRSCPVTPDCHQDLSGIVREFSSVIRSCQGAVRELS